MSNDYCTTCAFFQCLVNARAFVGMKLSVLNIILVAAVVYICVLLISKSYDAPLSESSAAEDDSSYDADLSAHEVRQDVFSDNVAPRHPRADTPSKSPSAGSRSMPSLAFRPAAGSGSPAGNMKKQSPAVHFEDAVGELVDMSGDIGAADDDFAGVGMDDAWGGTDAAEPTKEDVKVQLMLKNTLRDDIQVAEENINGPLSQKVRNAYKAPKASDIRASAFKARELAPEITTRKLDGNVDFAMAYMYKGREPPQMVTSDAESAQWGITDAYMHQKIKQSREGH